MNLDKEIISQIWDGCSKQIVDGYVYIKVDDLVKLEIENILKAESNPLTMNEVATYLNSKGFRYDTDGKIESWIKK